jgi:phosphoserine phosphatase RsbU/P
VISSAAVRDHRSASESAEPLRILLLEDSRADAELIAARLEDAGLCFEIERVDSHAGFNGALTRGRFDIILSDYNVPGFDGTAALAAARLACPEVPFLVVSGALGDEKAIDLLKRGATDYVLKDRLERLAPSVQRALREAKDKAERARAEAQLHERERTLSTLIENLPGMAFRCSPHPPWPFEFASEGCLALTGYRPEDFYANGTVTWAAIMHPDDRERVAAEAAEAFGERRQLTVTYRIRTQQGGERWVWDRSLARYASDGTLQCVEGFASDITQQRLAEQEIKQRAEFEQQLIGIVSHDLRNPLNAITLGAEMVLLRNELTPKNGEAVRRILSNAQRAARMIRDLLDFTQARLGGGIPVERKPLDLHAHAGLVLGELQHLHSDRKLDLRREGDTRGEWDPDRIAQVIINLVGNALKYSPPDTPVTVSVRGGADQVILEVHNYGEAIAPELLPHLFTPLSRGAGKVDMQTRSIGLGLFIVDSIVKGHGGRVSARSAAEVGTTFSVELPRLAQPS